MPLHRFIIVPTGMTAPIRGDRALTGWDALRIVPPLQQETATDVSA